MKPFSPGAILAFAFVAVPAALAAAPEAAGLEFFEKHIRPVLVESCYKCHSAQAEKLKGGLLLDTREGVLKGGDTGPAVIPGDPEKSLLIKAVRYTDKDLQMPPAKSGEKLAPEVVAHFEAWVKMGAPDPRTGQTQASKSKPPSSEHWAFKPVKKPAVPAIRNNRLAQTEVDGFILAKLEAKGIVLAPRADRRTLIRRASYTLTGLPPTPEEVRAFEDDRSPDAFAKVVDGLLASPRYGERWGRYWLDVARFADTKGYVFEEERKYPYSYTYRDWVIRAFNEDLPYDQFLVQQLAADRLPLGDDKRPLAALGFLTLGRRFLNNQQDIIDDRIDVVARGTMALTVACARCHDHKFDPVSQKDYYSLYGVFASSHEPKELPLLGSAATPKEYPAYVAERNKRDQELADYIATKEEDIRSKFRAQVGDYLLAVHDATKGDEDKKEGLYRERKLQPALARAYKDALKNWQKNSQAIFGPWFALTALPSSNFAAQAKETVAQFAATVNPQVGKLFSTNPPASLKEAAESYNKLFAGVDKEWRAARTNTPSPKALADASREDLRQVLYGDAMPIMSQSSDQLRSATDTPVQQKIRALKRKVDELDATHPGAPPRAMAMADNATPTEPRVFKRGNPGLPGDTVRRQFLEAVSGPNRQPFTNGSGRLELARAITSRDNPLTARVWVNRVWLHHFDSALVRTPADFGVRCEPPTHPELLDWLAARFMDDGWSIKKLHRLILLSAAWQQGSEDNPKAAKIDPANQLLWRQHRQRLDLEAMRDTLLAVSGQLDLTVGGHAVDIVEPATTRRTVYGFVERQNLPGLFRTFDFASPDTTSAQRFHTTVPQQALFLMNSPFVVRQAQRILERAEVKSAPSDEQRLQRLHQIVLQRTPDPDELKLAQQFLAAQATGDVPAEPPAWSYGYGKFDEQAKQVAGFTALPHWTGYGWQGGPQLPDPKLGWVLLNAEGGHVGNDQNHAAIRRWRAPRDGVVSITGELSHPSDKGDGIRARLVSSRGGLLNEWTAHNSKTGTVLDRLAVKRGEFLDFVTDCRTSVAFDSFHWSPEIKMTAATGAVDPDAFREWSARTGFAGPPKPAEKRPLSPWEKYAQVLLLSNELMFVD